MAIEIIVDGYNFIGGQRGLADNIEAQREELIGLLSDYRVRKGYQITVVFDGGRAGWLDEHGEIREGIHVVFSRQGESADQVIIRMAQDLGSACVVVSSDREVARKAEQSGAVSVEISEFERKIREADRAAPWNDKDELDQVSRPSTRKRGNPRRLSKEERKRRQRLNKL